jgi:pimeloyl-ACP methyl ester carboxylesterase
MEAMVRSILIYYEEYGTGIPILMLHGWPADHRQMVDIMEPLFHNRKGWRRIYLDMPGFGKTPGSELITNQDQMLEMISDFMQTVAPGERFVVTGYSFGGYIARGLVYQKGTLLDGLFLLEPVGEPDFTKRQLPSQQVLVEDPQFQASLRPEECQPPNYPSFIVIQSLEVLEWLRTTLFPAIADVDQSFWVRISEHATFSFPVDKLNTSFPAPTLILTGRYDALAGYLEAWTLLENFPRGTFAVLDRAGHVVPIEQKALFRSLTNEWLNRVEEYIAQNSVLTK